MTESTGADPLGDEIRHIRIVVLVMVAAALIGFVVYGNGLLGAQRSIGIPVIIVGAGSATANNVQRLLRRGRAHRDEFVVERQPEGGADSRSADLTARSEDVVDRRLVISQIYFSPVIGATFAFLLFGLFMSGVLQGGFFPSFACAEDRYTSFQAFTSCSPTTNGDVAKVLVWAFVAGFSERFVPNILDGIAVTPTRG
jgi:hypothetical protein